MVHRQASFATVSTLRGVRGSRVLLVAADYLADPLSSQIALLQSDIASQGWDVDLQVMSGGTVEDLKTLLQNTPDLDGAILIGFLPCAWYEDNYFAEEEFPCELFLMDLDGTWTDSDGDGLYDGHSGDVAPEIWLGRIDAHAAPGPEIPLLAEYLEKNHLYRTGSMGLDQAALTFNDDDWSYYSDCGLNGLYGPSNVTVVNSSSQTTADDYLLFLDQGYEFVHLMAHSCPWGHTFKVPGGMAGTVMAPEISQVNPRTAFYQLFSCSNARWVGAGMPGQLVPVRNRLRSTRHRSGQDRLHAGLRGVLRPSGLRQLLRRSLQRLVGVPGPGRFLRRRGGHGSTATPFWATPR